MLTHHGAPYTITPRRSEEDDAPVRSAFRGMLLAAAGVVLGLVWLVLASGKAVIR